MATLVWKGPEGLELADLPTDGGATLGRSADAQIRVDHGTVSRIHARVTGANGGYVIENLSRTNAIVVSGKEVASAKLKDADTVELGLVRIVFSDLTSVVVKNRLLCPHCRRVNELTRKDCWFCGENLVNATLSRLPTTKAAGAIVSESCLRAVALQGERTAPPESGATPSWQVEGRVDGIWLLPGGGITVNGEPAATERKLAHGDRIGSGGEEWLALVPE